MISKNKSMQGNDGIPSNSAVLDESVSLFDQVLQDLSQSSGIVKGYVIDLISGGVIDSFDSPYFTALVMDELLPFLTRDFSGLLGMAADFLLHTGSPTVGWSFFPNSKRYPTDTDDTAVVADLLLQLGALESPMDVVRLLEANRCENSSFYVWMASGEGARWKNTTDRIVDINVARFMLRACSGSFTPPSSLRELLSRFPQAAESIYSRDRVVCSWFVSRIERTDLLTRFKDSKPERAERVARLLEATGTRNHHPGLVGSLASTYRIQESTRDSFTAADLMYPIFHHHQTKIGYACPMLELAGFLRSILLNKQKEEHRTALSGQGLQLH